MDWALAIDRNREQLLRIVATLFAMIGLADGVKVERLSWPLHRMVLNILRPAEAAVRRLIVVAARDLAVPPPEPRAAPVGLGPAAKSRGRMAFRLFDPRRNFNQPRSKGKRPEPRIHIFDLSVDPRVPLFSTAPVALPDPAPPPPPTVNAEALCRRLAAISRALEDLPRQARRYARWRAKPLERRRPQCVSALRPGAPPGYRKDVPHLVHAILHECHWLARQVGRPDTS
jgi:hypothetical protein